MKSDMKRMLRVHSGLSERDMRENKIKNVTFMPRVSNKENKNVIPNLFRNLIDAESSSA